MKINSSSWFIGLLMSLVIMLSLGYMYSCNLHNEVTEIWKQALWEDCINRMSEINAKKIHVFSSIAPQSVEIEDENQILHLEKDSTKFLTTDEGNFLADQFYLSAKNPIKLEKLDSLFRIKLKENGFEFKIAVSLYNTDTDKKTFFGQEDVKLLHDYLKLKYKVDIRDSVLLEGYVKGCWLENLLYGKGYYISLSIILFFTLTLLLIKKKKIKYLKHDVLVNDLPESKLLTLSVESVLQQQEIIAAHKEECLSPEFNLHPTIGTILLDKKRHSLVYADKEISLAPKVFALFYQLAQEKDYFQSYDFLLQSLWSDAENADKKHLEQLVIRLRKDLKVFPWLSIDAIRGSGYQIKGKNDVKIIIEQFECNSE